MKMHAAVVRSFDRPPRCELVDPPVATQPDEAVVDVVAVGLHPRVRSGASGAHYTSTGTLPLIPGIDGVGRLADGRLVYFVSADDACGSMAERALVDLRRTIELPTDADLIAIAAAMNPAMSSWVALRRRVPLQPGQSVLVLGATGNAGGMAIRIAKLLGAGRVVGAGRNAERLAQLAAFGADAVVELSDDDEVVDGGLAEAAAEVDVVVDYVWGKPAAIAMMALLRARPDRSRALDWIQIGATAGPTIELPSVAVRSANLRIQGNGQGAVSPAAYLAELPSLVDEIGRGTLGVQTASVALSDVERAWGVPDQTGVRTVVVPG